MANYNVGENNPRWKGGLLHSNGYIKIRMPEHPRADSLGYVKRAILVLEAKLGRPLRIGADSHHINEIKDDDSPENLEEEMHSEHVALHHRGKRWHHKQLHCDWPNCLLSHRCSGFCQKHYAVVRLWNSRGISNLDAICRVAYRPLKGLERDKYGRFTPAM